MADDITIDGKMFCISIPKFAQGSQVRIYQVACSRSRPSSAVDDVNINSDPKGTKFTRNEIVITKRIRVTFTVKIFTNRYAIVAV